MADIAQRLERLRGTVPVPEKTDGMERFRNDFKTVWAWWRSCGYLSDGEKKAGVDRNAKDIKARMGNPKWIADESQMYADLVAQINANLASSERIREDRAARDEK